MLPGRRQNALDLASRDQRPRRIVHRDKLDLIVQYIQSGLDRILSSDTAAYYSADFSQVRFSNEMPHRYGFTGYNKNIVYTGRLFECGQGMLNHRTASDFRQQLVKTGPPAPAGGDDDGG